MSHHTACICCGRSIAGIETPTTRGPMHFDCWDEHHSDPTGPWPEDHRCDLDDVEDQDQPRHRTDHPCPNCGADGIPCPPGCSDR